MEDISKMKVADLKKELKHRGLAITGNKTDLIERLEEAMQSTPSNWVEGDDDEEFDEDEILADEPKEAPKSAKKKAPAIKRAADTPSKGSPLKAKVAKTATATNGVAKPETNAVKKPALSTETKEDPKMKSPSKEETSDDTTPEKDSTASTTNNTDKTLSALQSRAERFGVPLTGSAAAAARAARFGTTESNGESKGPTVDITQLKSRAERFGEVTSKKLSKVTSVDVEQLKARADRFGEVTSKNLVKLESVEKKKAREERFQSETDSKEEGTTTTTTTSSGKSLITAPAVVVSGEDSIKKKRAEKFGV